MKIKNIFIKNIFFKIKIVKFLKLLILQKYFISKIKYLKYENLNSIENSIIYQYLSYENDKTLISKILYNSEKSPSLITGSI